MNYEYELSGGDSNMQDTLRYKVSIDVKKKNDSHSCMISLVKENSTVPDIGCACSDLGKYLHDHKNCRVMGVDSDKQSVRVAEETGTFERAYNIDIWSSIEELTLLKDCFDSIILVDVIEHLGNPEQTLVKLSQFLKDDRFFNVSLSNIAHGSIKIDFLENRFNYTHTGLLYSTHMRFFIKESILALFDHAKLTMQEIKEVSEPFKGTLEDANTKNLPRGVLQFIENDQASHVYQYIIKARMEKNNFAGSTMVWRHIHECNQKVD